MTESKVEEHSPPEIFQQKWSKIYSLILKTKKQTKKDRIKRKRTASAALTRMKNKEKRQRLEASLRIKIEKELRKKIECEFKKRYE